MEVSFSSSANDITPLSIASTSQCSSFLAVTILLKTNLKKRKEKQTKTTKNKNQNKILGHTVPPFLLKSNSFFQTNRQSIVREAKSNSLKRKTGASAVTPFAEDFIHGACVPRQQVLKVVHTRGLVKVFSIVG